MLCLNEFNAYMYNYVDTFYVQMNYTSTSLGQFDALFRKYLCVLRPIPLISEPLISACTPVSRTTVLVSRNGINVYEAVSKSSMSGLSTAIETKV